MCYRTIVRARVSKIKNIAKNKKNNTFAIPAEAAAIPVNPNKPAMIEMIKNRIAKRSIKISFKNFISYKYYNATEIHDC